MIITGLKQVGKWLRAQALALVLMTLTVSPAFAATLQLYSIGNSVTTGKTFTTFSYAGENPIFVGSASAKAQVNIALNAATNKVTADDSGAWVFTPTTLLVGSHEVVISSGTETKSFTLNISSASATITPTATPTVRPTTTSTAAALPVTGGEGFTWMIVLAGVMMLGLGMMGWSIIAPVQATQTNMATEPELEEHD